MEGIDTKVKEKACDKEKPRKVKVSDYRFNPTDRSEPVTESVGLIWKNQPIGWSYNRSVGARLFLQEMH